MDLGAFDREIREAFEREKVRLSAYQNQLHVLKSLTVKLNTLDVVEEVRKLEEKITAIQDETQLQSYHLNTMTILAEYRKLTTQTKKISFVGKRVDTTGEREQQLYSQYIAVANPYRELLGLPLLDKAIVKTKANVSTSTKVVCDACKGTEFQVDDVTRICQTCGVESDIPMHGVNEGLAIASTKSGSYDRRVHFRDCINQYQGKQHCTIEKKVYDDLKEEFRKNHLLNEDEEGYARFSRIRKEHVNIFLKVLNYTKHYENVNLIHYNLTGKKPDDISYLEETLMKDFDALTELYDQKFRSVIDRRNFINTPSVLYQLLRKHKHPCKDEDFVLLKTVERMSFHDSILEELFRELGWNYYSTF